MTMHELISKLIQIEKWSSIEGMLLYAENSTEKNICIPKHVLGDIRVLIQRYIGDIKTEIITCGGIK